MDAERFDTLIRSFASRWARRGVLAGLVSGLLAGVPLVRTGNDTAAKKSRKRKKKCKGGKEKCGKKCKGGTEKCGKTCVAKCAAGEARNPLTCECCRTGYGCEGDADCCSGRCQPNTAGGPDYCLGRHLDAQCDFDAQCYGTTCPPDACPRATCQAGRCACPDGSRTCHGACLPPCSGGNVQIPGECECCRRNGQSCGAGADCCSKQCISGMCLGLPFDAPCDFGEQCISEVCTLGFCNP
jgi:hypothetical protein